MLAVYARVPSTRVAVALASASGYREVVWLNVLDSRIMGSSVGVMGPICEMVALVDWTWPELVPGAVTPAACWLPAVPGAVTPAACWLPATPCPTDTAPACKALLGTPGNAPPASERVTFHPRMSGL